MTAPTIPTNAAELEDLVGSDEKFTATLNDPTKRKEFFAAYADAARKNDPTVKAQVDEGIQQGLARLLNDAGVDAGKKTPVPLNIDPTNLTAKQVDQVRKNKLYNKAAKGASLDGMYGSSEEFFQAIWHRSADLENGDALSVKAREHRKVQNNFGSQVPSDGGFLIPEVLRSELLMWSLENSIVRPRATVIPMSGLRTPIPMVDSTSNVSSTFGGIVTYWTEEAAKLVNSSAKFGVVTLDAKKLTAYSVVPNELPADAPAFGGFISRAFPQAIAFGEDYAFQRGTGAGEPMGSINNPAVATVLAEAGQPTATIVWQNIVKMFARMLPSSLGTAVWVCSIDTFPELATMALSVGTGGAPVWLNNGTEGPPMTILGRPVIFTEKTPALGTTGDITFVDFAYYLIGDRQILQASSSEHIAFDTDQTAYKFIERVDGRPWLQSAITPKNNSANTLSPFVQLATRP